MALFDVASRGKPILKWAGGKSGILNQLVEKFPSNFSRYIEPFLGGAAVFLALKEGTPAILNDYNEELFNLYTVVGTKPRELMSALDKMSELYSQDYFYELRATSFNDPVSKAARTVFLNKTGFNGLYRQNSQGRFNVPFGRRLTCPALYDEDNLLAVSKRLSSASIHNFDFEKVIEQAGVGDLVYCDPPYEPLTQTSSFNAYTGGGFSIRDQERLRDACEGAALRGACVVISNSTSPRILDLYKRFEVRRVLAKRAINSKGNGRREIEEVLAFSYDPKRWYQSTTL